MPVSTDKQRFRNEDLVLRVSTAVNRQKWDESRYEGFLEELCGTREYQREAIRSALRYLLGGQYSSLKALARESFDANPVLADRYGSWAAMQRQLQLPEQLSASLDLATGTGKSYVLYGLAAIMLAEGVVDSVLVLCPSTTIEAGLIEKFRDLAGNASLRALLPSTAKTAAPSVINASESIVTGSLCVENYHAILEHVGSSIRDSLSGKGGRVLVLNDEAHHVANEIGKTKKWKEFLTSADFGFRYIIGVSGTCYIKDDYFSDVIYRFSLRQAMEQNYVKQVDYVAETSYTARADEKWQLIRSRHNGIKQRLNAHNLLPLTIIVTKSIQDCKDVVDELKAFLVDSGDAQTDTVDELVLSIYSEAPDLRRLPYVDNPTSKVEWVVSVSMLTEGWDVKRVFQIVPHEERAFNSKLLISQVLGRGLRVPNNWQGAQPEVLVFNHDAWAGRIRQLVNEILEREKRVSAFTLLESPFHFTLSNIDYSREQTSVKKPMTGPYNMLEKGYVDLASDSATDQITTVLERAATGNQYTRQEKITHKTYSTQDIALVMYQRLKDAYDPSDPDPNLHHDYTTEFPMTRLIGIVTKSLELCGMTEATDATKQKFLQALGTLRRKQSENVRYELKPNNVYEISTHQRQADSVSAPELRNDKTYFFTDQTITSLSDDQKEFFKEASELGSGFQCYPVANRLDFKVPLNAVIADSTPERRFILSLLAPENLPHYDAWIKSTSTRFYEIEYSWKKGEHPKLSKFNPDFFIKAGDLILVAEIKHDDELREPSEENRKKNEYAVAHFDRINKHLEERGSPVRYRFNFLTPNKFGTYFQYLREGRIDTFRSSLDVQLLETATTEV